MRASTHCELWLGDEQRYCRSTDDVHFFLFGRRCSAHAPRQPSKAPSTRPSPSDHRVPREYGHATTDPLGRTGWNKQTRLPTFTDSDVRTVITGPERKAEGQQRALATAEQKHEQWLAAAKGQIVVLANRGEPFTSEDVTAVVGLPAGRTGMNENNGVGALMTAAARRGLIEKCGRRASQRASSNSAEITLWRGVRRGA